MRKVVLAILVAVGGAVAFSDELTIWLNGLQVPDFADPRQCRVLRVDFDPPKGNAGDVIAWNVLASPTGNGGKVGTEFKAYFFDAEERCLGWTEAVPAQVVEGVLVAGQHTVMDRKLATRVTKVRVQATATESAISPDNAPHSSKGAAPSASVIRTLGRP